MSMSPVDLPPLEPTSVRPGGQWQPPPAEARVVAPVPPSDAWSITGAGSPTRPEEILELLVTWPETRNLQTPQPIVQLKQLFASEAIDPSEMDAVLRKLQTVLQGSQADSIASDWTIELTNLLRAQLATLVQPARPGGNRQTDGLAQLLRHTLSILNREQAPPAPAPRVSPPSVPSAPSVQITQHADAQSYTFSERETASGLLAKQPVTPSQSSGNPSGTSLESLPSPRTPGATNPATPPPPPPPRAPIEGAENLPTALPSDRASRITTTPPSSQTGPASLPTQTPQPGTGAAGSQPSSTPVNTPQLPPPAPTPLPLLPPSPAPLPAAMGQSALQTPLPPAEPMPVPAAANPSQPSANPASAPTPVQPSLAEIVARIGSLSQPPPPPSVTRWAFVARSPGDVTSGPATPGAGDRDGSASPTPSPAQQGHADALPRPASRNPLESALRATPHGQSPATNSATTVPVKGDLRAETPQSPAVPAGHMEEPSQNAMVPQQRVGMIPLMVGQEAMPAWLHLEWLPVHDREGHGGQSKDAQALMVSVHIAGETLGRVAFHLAWLPKELAGTIVMEKPEVLRIAQEELPSLEERLAEAGLPPPRLRILQHASAPWEEEPQEVDRT